MKIIFKYQLEFGKMNKNGIIKLNMPIKSKILSLQVQNGIPCL